MILWTFADTVLTERGRIGKVIIKMRLRMRRECK